MNTKGIKISGLKKRYGTGETAVDALKGVDMHVNPERSWASSDHRVPARARS